MLMQNESRIPVFNCSNLDKSNIGVHWEKWKRGFEIYLIAENVTDLKRKKALLLHLAGSDVQDIFFSLPNADDVNEGDDPYDKTVKNLDEYFMPKKNISYERHVFRSLKQEVNESINSYVMRLRQQGKYCEYADLNEEIRDQIIEKCISNELRKKLLERSKVTLDDAISLAQTLEITQHQMETLKGENVNALNQKKKIVKGGKYNDYFCFRCGLKGHISKDLTCPARDKKCKKCNNVGHFWKMCKTKDKKNKNKFRKTYQVDEGNMCKKENDSDDTLFGIINQVCEDAMFTFKVGTVPIKMMVDSGASCNVINRETWEYLKRNKVNCELESCYDKKLYAYGSKSPLKVLGKFTTEIEIANLKTKGKFYVVNEGKLPLLGKETSEDLGILKIGLNLNAVNSEKIFQRKCFRDVGKLKNFQLNLAIDRSITPVVQPYRRIPLLWQKKVEKKLEQLLNLDIIEKVENSTTWVSPIVVIPKGNNDIRLCVDMRMANTAIKRQVHPMPTIDDILPDLGRSKIFSKLDISSAFHQIELSPDSRDITTFITHKGLFRYKRLMFGLNCASENFQSKVEQILRDCEGCKCFVDDILVYGETEEEHDKRLNKVLQTLEDAGLTLGKSKCLIGVSELDYLGHKLTSKGIMPSENKIKAIQNFRRPKDKEEVKSFLGLVNFVARYIPNLSSVNEPLRNLTRYNSKFKWGKKEDDAFQKLKIALTSDSILGYFNPGDKTQVVADASPVGLGAVLLQRRKGETRIICYASKSLSPTEKRYSQTEKEALAIIWACEKFKMYLLGQEFDLLTDHKPLEVIFGKRSKPCARIERWVLRLQSFRYNIIHIPGKKNIADSLPRLCENTEKDEAFDKFSEKYLNIILKAHVPKAMTEEEIEKETRIDLECKEIKLATESGNWNEVKHPYAMISNELSYINGILFRGTRIVIPKALRNRVLEIAHEGHPGIVQMKQLVRSKVWWPQIDKDVEKKVKSCHGCQLVTVDRTPEPLKKREFPTEPWKELALDFMGPLPSGDYILVVIDYYSKYFEVEIMKTITTADTVKRLKVMFARFGYPISITMDNGPQLAGKEMKEFCETSGIRIIHTTPYWPQANGEVEVQNRTLLKRLRIAQSLQLDWKEELLKFLLMYRTTEHSTTGVTPAELMFGRKLRGKIPSFAESSFNKEEMNDRVYFKGEKEKRYVDKKRRAKESNIREGAEVLVKQDRKNKLSTYYKPEPCTVVNKNGNSVTLKSPDGVIFKRNSTYVKSYERPEEIQEPDIDNTQDQSSTTEVEISFPTIPSSEETECDKLELKPNETKSRPKREKKLPAHFKDFIMN